MVLISRRFFLAAGAPWALGCGAAARANSAAPRFGAARKFTFDRLRQRAKALAAQPYAAAPPPAQETVGRIDFDLLQKIRFRPDRALWRDAPGRFPVRLFHLDRFHPHPVRINVVSDGMARPVAYSPQDFDYGDSGLADKLPAGLGFSGFRVMNGRAGNTDWLAFQGSSYFRSAGEAGEYGASARGIAVNTALTTREEFPRFTEFWLAQPESGRTAMTVFALLDGPSVTGAYRLSASKERGAVIDVDAELFIRADIARLGIAPLTSMYWYGENDRQDATDWRPEVHDSDGLALWTGSNERIWRPLINPPSVGANSFLDVNPKGFGLMQRDRDFASYQDERARYYRRPSVWVEPRGDWGEGAVQLIEIPARDENRDNVVAYWQPKRSIKAGDQLAISYRLHWRNDAPHPPRNVGRVVATRTGAARVPELSPAEIRGTRTFAVDFAGGPLGALSPHDAVTAAVSASRGEVGTADVTKVLETGRWRTLFALRADGKDLVNLRCYLRLADRTLTETWLYQYIPEA